MFIDEARITIKAGSGGDGIISFQNRPGQRHGGPDGGNGGDGGDVYLKAVSSMGTMLEFNNKDIFTGEDGGKGGDQKKRGKDGEDLYVNVPVGTVIYDADSGEKLADLSTDAETVLVAEGGDGGRGNSHFSSAKRPAPRIREWGEPGEERNLQLELKMLGDVGIVGFPNVGKSSLISKISSQHPKIGNYPFTTMDPHPGVVKVSDWEDFVAIDIPGIIEGAHQGKGIGNKFLRHLERTQVLLHMVDLAGIEGRDPIEDWETLREEIRKFNPEILEREEIVVGNKIDLMDPEEVQQQVQRFEERDVELHPISVSAEQGLDNLVSKTHEMVKRAEADITATSSEEKSDRKVYKFQGEQGYKVVKAAGRFIVKGQEIGHLAAHLDLSTEDALNYFYERLERKGVIRELEKEGAQEGSLIEIGGREFEYVN